MLHYLLIADAGSDEQKKSYFKLSEYLNSLNCNSNVFFVKFNVEEPEYYLLDLVGKDEKQIMVNTNFRYKYTKMLDLCKKFIRSYAENDVVFILMDSCLINSPLNNISFNQYYNEEYTYKLYNDIWEFVNSSEGYKYKPNTNWGCFSRGDVLLGFMSRALIQMKGETIDRYKIKNLIWFNHKETNDVSKLVFSKIMESEIGKI